MSGNVITAGIDLVSLALTARALGPELFGVLVLVQTYARFVDQFVNFQSWQAIIKYGADSLTDKRTGDFRSLVKLGTSLDLGGSLLGTTVAIAMVYWVGRWFEWEDETVRMAAMYSLTILLSLSPTPTAVLRLFDRFNLLAWQRVISAAIRMAALVVAWFVGADLWGFLVVWMVAQILDYLFLLALGWRELRRQGFGDALSAPLMRINAKFPGIWKFVITTNLSSSIRLGARELDVLIVGGTIGSAAAGIYKVAKQFAGVPPSVTLFGPSAADSPDLCHVDNYLSGYSCASPWLLRPDGSGYCPYCLPRNMVYWHVVEYKGVLGSRRDVN